MKLSRDQVYEQVWSRPLPDVASELNMSVETLRRVCGLLDVPLPKAGHWRRANTPRRKALPKLNRDEPSFIALVKRGEKMVIDGSAIPGAKVRADSGAKIKELHPLVERAQKFYAYPKLGSDGRMKPSSNSAPSLRVSEAQKQRALVLVDKLFKRLEELGCELEWKGNATVTSSDGSVPISIQEEIESKERPPTQEEVARRGSLDRYSLEPRKYFRDEPSGRLILAIETYYFTVNSTRQWKDEDKRKLESRTEEIAAGIVAYIRDLRLAKEAEAERRRKYDEDERQRKEEERLRQIEQGRRERLSKALDGWDRASKIRRYADELEVAWSRKHGTKPDEATEAWLKWMRDYADRIDPLITEI